MNRAILFVPFIALAACATPQERCISQVSANARTIDALIAETRVNIARGYGIAEHEEVDVINKRCERKLESGETIRFPCDEVVTHTVRTPVAIDLNAEEAKLQSLLERRAAIDENLQANIQQCIAANPE